MKEQPGFLCCSNTKLISAKKFCKYSVNLVVLINPSIMTSVHSMLINRFKVPVSLKSFILGSSWNLNPSVIGVDVFILTMTEFNLNIYLKMTNFC